MPNVGIGVGVAEEVSVNVGDAVKLGVGVPLGWVVWVALGCNVDVWVGVAFEARDCTLNLSTIGENI